jgi:uncharacterized repeat protein (TIGR01451 family)
MNPGRRFSLSALLAMLLLPAVGCVHNPSEFPYWWPTGAVVPTHAKPGGFGAEANFDPHAVRLEVRPLRCSNPVNTQHLVIATILDDKGDARRKRRVEWMLEGAGNIIEVDESGLLLGRGYKVDNKYAVTYTSLFEQTVKRGSSDAAGDAAIQPGQTWCIITSPIEGESRLTVYAPEIHDWEHRTAMVSVQWVDCRWQFPAPATARSGAPFTLTTHLFRHTDNAPVPNYRIRYTLLDGGPQAELLPNRSREAIVSSDQAGNASVGIQQLALAPGVNRLGIEVLRPADSANPAGSPVVLASQETTVDWQAPQIQLNITAPQSAAVGQEIPTTITITNSGQVDTQSGTVSMQVPPGMSYVRSDPAARIDDKGSLIWDLNQLGGGRQQTVNLTVKARERGVFPARVVAMTRDSLQAEQANTYKVEPGGLKLALVGPTSGVVGVPVDYQIQITNPSAAEVSKVILDLWLDPGRVAIAPGGKRFETKLQNDQIPPLKPNETRTLAIKFDAKKAARLNVRAMASAEGGLGAEQSTIIDFSAPQVELKRTGPAQVYVGRQETWSLQLRNSGSVPLTGATLRDRLPAELTFRSATDGGTLDPRTGEVVWSFGNVAAGEERVVRVSALAARPGTRAVMSGQLTANPNVQQKADNTIQVLGIPALRVDVTSDVNPVEVGKQVTYTIRLTNQGTLPADQIDVAAEVPPLMRALGGRGPKAPATRGNTVTFPALANLQPGQTATLIVFGQAIEAGDARFRVTVQSPVVAQPVVTEEATRIVAPGAPVGTR